jgi:hypothetical protein
MKKADFIKAFKNKAAWKKAKSVIILVDYKLEGKKAVIAIPFKKENEMKLEMKRLKKEKLHILKKSGGGTIKIEVGADGQREAKIELGIGGLKPELLLLKASPLFGKIKLRIQATQNEEAMADAAASEGEVDTNENLPEDSLDDVAVDESPEEAESAEPETEEADNNTSLITEINSLTSRIGTLFRDRIQPIANEIRGNSATQEHLQQTEETSELIDSLKEKFESAGEEVKRQVNDSVNRILNLVPNLDRIKTALRNLFRGNSNENTNTTEQGGSLNEGQATENVALDRNKLKSYADQGKAIADEFKSLKDIIKTNLEDLQSENEDVEKVSKMIEKVQKHEDIFDAMSEEEKEKVQKMRDTIKTKVTPELEKMMDDVVRYLRVRDNIAESRARDQQGVRDNIQDLRSRLESLKASLAN